MVSANILHLTTVIFCLHVQIRYGYTQGANSTAMMNSSFTSDSTLNFVSTTTELKTTNASLTEKEHETSSSTSVSESPFSTEPSSTTMSASSSTSDLPSTSSSESTSTTSEAITTSMSSTSESVPKSTTITKTTSSQSMPTTTKKSMSKASTQDPPSLQSPFGTYGLVAFSIAFAAAVAELIIILVLIYFLRCNRKHEYNTAEAESRQLSRNLGKDEHMETAFGGVHTVDLDSDNEENIGNRKLGTSNGGVTTFGTKPNNTEPSSEQNEQPDNKPATEVEQPDTEIKQPDWLKVELSPPGTKEEANELIEPISPVSQGPTSPLSTELASTDQETTSPLIQSSSEEFGKKDIGEMSETESEPLLPPPPPELDIAQSPTSSLSDNSY